MILLKKIPRKKAHFCIPRNYRRVLSKIGPWKGTKLTLFLCKYHVKLCQFTSIGMTILLQTIFFLDIIFDIHKFQENSFVVISATKIVIF